MPQVYRMKDSTDSYTINKPGGLWNLPMRLALVGRTGAGKTSVLGNLLLRPDMYKGDWNAENIFIISGSLHGDAKLKTIIDQLEIPKSNLFHKYDPLVLDTIYEELMDRYNEAVADKKKPEHSLIILDDVSFTGRMARHGAKDDPLNRIISNGRKFLVSIINTAQKYTQLSTTIRENLSGGMIGQSTNKQLALIETDHNYLRQKKDFENLFRQQTRNAHDYFIFSHDSPAYYLNHDFKELPNLLQEKGMA